MSITLEQFIRSLTDSGILSLEEIDAFHHDLNDGRPQDDAREVCQELVRRNVLTGYQFDVLYEGSGDPLLLGDYVVLDKIGQGGMGVVFKARCRSTRDVVAIKSLPFELTEDEDAIKRFRREIRTAKKLSHPNIVTTLGSGVVDDKSFLVMEFVDGRDLSVLVKESGPVPLLTAVDSILQAARGLEYAHSEGVIHRDIKPSNLLYDREATVKILDMGLARTSSAAPNAALDPTITAITRSGAVVGTLDYISPEQALNSRNADERADIYALGCTLCFLLLGKPVYSGETVMEKLIAHREHPIPTLARERSEVPHELDLIFSRMIAKKPHDRYARVGEVIDDLMSCRDKYRNSWMMRRLSARFKEEWPRPGTSQGS
jgi:serine/threonine protein kinase